MPSHALHSSIMHEVDDIFGIEGRALGVLLENPDVEFTKKDLLSRAGVSATFFKIYFEKLSKRKLIVKTKKVGKAELFKLNLENDLANVLEKWYSEKKEERKMQQIMEIYEEEYKGKETPEDNALVKLLVDINATIPKNIENELERVGFILTKDKKRYWTTRGLEVAKSLVEFEKIVSKQKA